MLKFVVISNLAIGEAIESLNFYDALLEIADADRCMWKAIQAGKRSEGNVYIR